MHLFRLLDQFVRAPRDTGSIVPSSQALARQILSAADLAHHDAIVEFGPGTGVFTEHLVNLVRPDAVFFAIEINPFLAKRTRQRCPTADVHCGSATDVVEYLNRYGLQKADCIVSSLPWGAFGPELQDALFNATLDALKPGGHFVTFTYFGVPWMPQGRAFRRRLEGGFSNVETSPVVWRNVPPALVYSCTR